MVVKETMVASPTQNHQNDFLPSASVRQVATVRSDYFVSSFVCGTGAKADDEWSACDDDLI